MKKFYSILFALLAIVGVANASDGGNVLEKTLYDVPTGDFDIDYHTTEVIPEGKTVVVFYYTHKDISFTKRDFAFGSNYKEFAYSNEKDADGNLVVRFYDKDTPIVKSNQSLLINLYSDLEDGSQWAYVICDVADKTTVADPFASQGGGDDGGEIKPADPNNNVIAGTVYSLPIVGEEGYVNDANYTMATPAGDGQYVVFFMNSPAGGISFPKVIYNQDGKDKYVAGSVENGTNNTSMTFKRFYLAGPQQELNIYLEDLSKSGYTWCYVIANSLDEAKTIANPADVAGSGPVADLEGQTEEKAITLTQIAQTVTTPVSKLGGEYVLYAKFTAAAAGTVKVTMPEGETWAKYLKKPGETTFKNFNFDNAIEVEKDQTYYIYYRYKEEQTGSASITLTEAVKGESRSDAILIEANGQQNLLGIAHVNDDYFNKTTWFKLEKDGTLVGNTLVTVTIGGSNETEVALFKNDETDAAKTYAMGSGTGMLPKNSTVKFDIDLSENDYYIAITQDDVNGTASFTFSVAQSGETIATAMPAVAGSNSVTTAGWYKYAHSGDTKLIKITGINKIVNEDGGNIAEGDDVKVGFPIADGTTIYFEAAASFTITLSDLEPGMTPENAVVIDNENGATFNMGSSVATDTQRFMKYTATEDGTFLYATQNAMVLDYAVSATVRDVTDPESPKNVSIVQEETDEFGETYFIYKWPVVAGHTYAIEQGLGNNFGTVEFLTMFTAAEAGETMGKAIAIDLYEAVDLGRKASTAKYYKFTAAESGDYIVSVQMKGYVKSYDAEGNGSSIGQSYTDGLVYHNGTFTLAAGETLVFSCEPSETIEHVGVAIQDQFIPNYYATVTKAGDTAGLDYNHPESITADDEMSLDASNVWYGPVTVPANTPLYVKASLTDETETSAVYFAVETTNGLQWINTNTALSVDIQGKTQIFTLAASTEERQIHILGYGLKCAGTFIYSFTEPQVTPDTKALTLVPTLTYNTDDKKLTIEVTIPEMYDESETPVENLNMWAVSITNNTTEQTIDLTNGGDGTYSAGDKLTAINVIDNAAFFNSENTYLVTFGSSDTSLTITATPTAVSTTTGIKNVNVENASAVMYNLAGQRINSAKGIVIINGKKVVK